MASPHPGGRGTPGAARQGCDPTFSVPLTPPPAPAGLRTRSLDSRPQEGEGRVVTPQAAPPPRPGALATEDGGARGPVPSSAPGLTLLAGPAGPALRAGAVARDGVAGAPVAAEAGVLAVLTKQARGAGWGGGGSVCSTHSQASGRPPRGSGAGTSPTTLSRTTCPLPPSPAPTSQLWGPPLPPLLTPPPGAGGTSRAHPAGSGGPSSRGRSGTARALGRRRPR